jgi:hypothetical protein
MTDFDALAADAHDARNKLGERAYARAALALDTWYFLGVAPPDAPDEPEPLIGPGAEGPRLLVFTDQPRAEGYRDHLGARGKAATVLHMDTPDAVDYCRLLRDNGVASVHFNDGPSAVTLPLTRLLQLAKQA